MHHKLVRKTHPTPACRAARIEIGRGKRIWKNFLFPDTEIGKNFIQNLVRRRQPDNIT